VLWRREFPWVARLNKVTLVSLGYPLSVFNKNSSLTRKKDKKEKKGGEKKRKRRERGGVWGEKKERGRWMGLGGSEE